MPAVTRDKRHATNDTRLHKNKVEQSDKRQETRDKGQMAAFRTGDPRQVTVTKTPRAVWQAVEERWGKKGQLSGRQARWAL